MAEDLHNFSDDWEDVSSTYNQMMSNYWMNEELSDIYFTFGQQVFFHIYLYILNNL